MDDIFVGQDFQLRLDANEDLTGCTLLSILYKKPSMTTFSTWTSGVLLEGTTILKYNIANTDLDEAGCWHFRLRVAFSDNTIGIGELAKLEVKEVE